MSSGGEPSRCRPEHDAGQQGQRKCEGQHDERGLRAYGKKGRAVKRERNEQARCANSYCQPAIPPMSDSKTLSTSACETMSRRAAPRAMRIAVWLERATARASNKLATLAHAI